MTPHALHEPIVLHGLADACDRCAEIAKEPLTHLDPGTLAEFWRRMVHVEKRQAGLPSSSTDAICLARLYRIAVFVDRFVEGVDAWSWPIKTVERRLSVVPDPPPLEWPWRERAVQLEGERDRARGLAIALEAELHQALTSP